METTSFRLHVRSAIPSAVLAQSGPMTGDSALPPALFAPRVSGDPGANGGGGDDGGGDDVGADDGGGDDAGCELCPPNTPHYFGFFGAERGVLTTDAGAVSGQVARVSPRLAVFAFPGGRMEVAASEGPGLEMQFMLRTWGADGTIDRAEMGVFSPLADE
jgi:hypothetical protein